MGSGGVESLQRSLFKETRISMKYRSEGRGSSRIHIRLRVAIMGAWEQGWWQEIKDGETGDLPSV